MFWQGSHSHIDFIVQSGVHHIKSALRILCFGIVVYMRENVNLVRRGKKGIGIINTDLDIFWLARYLS
jgi:hypothetical protein